MNYQRIYNQLIERSKTRIPPQGYIEHHHIIPRCMNGSDDKSNIAILTPEEHFVAHVLLVKIHPEIPELIVAVSRMCKGKGRKRRKLYGWLRRRHAEYMKLNQSGKGNSQHGTMWIHRDLENKKIKKNEMIPEGWMKGRQFRRNNLCKTCGIELESKRRNYCKSHHPGNHGATCKVSNQDLLKAYKKHGKRSRALKECGLSLGSYCRINALLAER